MMEQYCSRYDKKCEEALYFYCDIPTNSIYIEDQIKECKDCIFFEKERKQK